jgi:hypothetical protein
MWLAGVPNHDETRTRDLRRDRPNSALAISRPYPKTPTISVPIDPDWSVLIPKNVIKIIRYSDVRSCQQINRRAKQIFPSALDVLWVRLRICDITQLGMSAPSFSWPKRTIRSHNARQNREGHNLKVTESALRNPHLDFHFRLR